MSMKVRGLGSVAAAVAGIVASSSSNATPIVLTLTASHHQKNGDRIVVTGITGNTNANGEWTLAAVAATTAALVGSSGNAAHGGTAAIAALMDVSPFLPRHTVAAHIGNTPGAAVLVGTVIIEGSDDNSSFADAKADGLIAVPAVTAGIALSYEVNLKKYMRFRCSAYTSGAGNAQVQA
jgi:hypothetical protein